MAAKPLSRNFRLADRDREHRETQRIADVPRADHGTLRVVDRLVAGQVRRAEDVDHAVVSLAVAQRRDGGALGIELRADRAVAVLHDVGRDADELVAAADEDRRRAARDVLDLVDEAVIADQRAAAEHEVRHRALAERGGAGDRDGAATCRVVPQQVHRRLHFAGHELVDRAHLVEQGFTAVGDLGSDVRFRARRFGACEPHGGGEHQAADDDGHGQQDPEAKRDPGEDGTKTHVVFPSRWRQGGLARLMSHARDDAQSGYRPPAPGL
jgi:hypothetical protein